MQFYIYNLHLNARGLPFDLTPKVKSEISGDNAGKLHWCHLEQQGNQCIVMNISTQEGKFIHKIKSSSWADICQTFASLDIIPQDLCLIRSLEYVRRDISLNPEFKISFLLGCMLIKATETCLPFYFTYFRLNRLIHA